MSKGCLIQVIIGVLFIAVAPFIAKCSDNVAMVNNEYHAGRFIIGLAALFVIVIFVKVYYRD